ncbi:Ig-like domain-containing protein [Micromonospora sp. NPDC050397]|uniref:Ig-like domain-containing protein n=1 Tax=Micromonospora sp. NPDC050397 TaxID=3364279 RepID=UPI00384F6B78
MLRKITFSVAAVAMLALIPPPVAQAGGRNDVILGDVNGDGIEDRTVLGLANRNRCTVTVQLGIPGGQFELPTSYPYLTVSELPANCPDLGVAVNLDVDPAEEFVVAWFSGPPGDIEDTMLVLDRFVVVNRLAGQFSPSFMGTADFNGDGREDVYEQTDSGEGVSTFINTGDNTLVAGHEMCFLGAANLIVRGLHRTPDAAIVSTYLDDCELASGVTILNGNGSTQVLQQDGGAAVSWSTIVLYANGDDLIDIRTTDSDGAVTTFYNGTNRIFESTFLAVTDDVTIQDATRTIIPVRDNDRAGPDATIAIHRKPSQGTATVRSDRTILYTPSKQHGPTDLFTYRLTENGRSSTGTVNIQFVD